MNVNQQLQIFLDREYQDLEHAIYTLEHNLHKIDKNKFFELFQKLHKFEGPGKTSQIYWVSKEVFRDEHLDRANEILQSYTQINSAKNAYPVEQVDKIISLAGPNTKDLIDKMVELFSQYVFSEDFLNKVKKHRELEIAKMSLTSKREKAILITPCTYTKYELAPEGYAIERKITGRDEMIKNFNTAINEKLYKKITLRGTPLGHCNLRIFVNSSKLSDLDIQFSN